MPEMHRCDLDAPVVVVGTDPTTGEPVVVADHNLSDQHTTHALDYADRLARLNIPEPRHGQHGAAT